jgi:hypothetical protein
MTYIDRWHEKIERASERMAEAWLASTPDAIPAEESSVRFPAPT